MQELSRESTNLISYLKSGVSAYHVVAYTRRLLLEAGFEEVSLKDTWKLDRGGRYFCMPFGTTLYAFTVGRECDLKNGIHIGGAHTDFPAIKIKPNPEIFAQGYMQLNTEVYSGPILNTFFDRPLSLAGRVVTRGERYDRPVSHLVDFKDPVVYLPNLAVHMNREVNEKGVPIDNQKHLLPLLGTTGEALDKDTKFTEFLAERFDLKKEDILDYDLCIYNTQQPYQAGITGEFLCSPRLDDITSVCALIHGLIDSENADRINLVCLFDNEEIGSLSKQGADSCLPVIIVQKIWQAFGRNAVDCMADLSDGMMLSVDVAHAYHPNYPGSQDITNYPVLGKGFVLKTASNQTYSWDPEILAAVIALCEEKKIPYQRFVKHSNTRGGGTIGSVISSRLPMKTADLGVGLLAMHSSCEMMGAKDQEALEQFARAFFTE